MSTPIERAAIAAWPHYFTGDRNFDVARDEVLGIRAYLALDAALDVDELAQLLRRHATWGWSGSFHDDSVTCLCGATLDSADGHRPHIARAIREHLLTAPEPGDSGHGPAL